VSEAVFQQCINPNCNATYGVEEHLFACPKCQALLDIQYEWDKLEVPDSLSWFEKRWSTRGNKLDFSGVWRFRNLLPFCPEGKQVTVGEGQTVLQQCDGVADYVGMDKKTVHLQYEGMNPSGSFKDNGMTAAFSHANMIGAKVAACASTGNTSASLALYAHACGMQGVVFIGTGKIAYGKLSQALDYGAKTVQISGDFDDCMVQVKEVAKQLNMYLVNSVNPFRLEGQKSVMFRVLEGFGWEVPDWVIVPGGNLGNSSSFGKAFTELKALGLIDRIPRLAVINASGANTLYDVYEKQGIRYEGGHYDRAKVDAYFKNLDDTGYKPSTVASAIEISRPVNLAKCLRALEVCNGVVREVSDEKIVEAKAVIGKNGLGCEPASAASVAGLKILRDEGVIQPGERVACVLTGHQLKDPNCTVKYHMETAGAFSNPPVEVDNDLEKLIALLK